MEKDGVGVTWRQSQRQRGKQSTNKQRDRHRQKGTQTYRLVGRDRGKGYRVKDRVVEKD